MPKYNVTAPDGRKFVVTAPEGATQQQVIQYAQAQMRAKPSAPPAPRQTPSQVVASIPGNSAPVRRAAPAQDNSLVGRFRDSLAGVLEPIAAGVEGQLALATGSVGGVIGAGARGTGRLAREIQIGNFGTDAAAQRISQAAARGADALTYAPRLQRGREAVSGLAPVMENLAAVAPNAQFVAGAAAMPSAALLRPVAQRAATTARAGAQRVAQAVPSPSVAAAAAKERAAQAAGLRDATVAAELPRDSAGAASVPQAITRYDQMQSLPVPMTPTRGIATRDFGLQRFERETAKDPELGAPLRERFNDLNQQITQNLDAFEYQMEPTLSSTTEVGSVIDSAINRRIARDRKRIKAAYKRADDAGEMEAPVALTQAVQAMNDLAPDAAVTPLLAAARARAIQTGVAVEGPDGALVAQPVTLKTAETFRRALRNATDYEPTNIRASSIIRSAVDEQTRNMGKGLYRAARAERSRFAKDYENVRSIANIVGTRNGTGERQVAIENVLQQSVLAPSVPTASVRQLRRLLQTEGPEGMQAWKEVQAAVIRHIRDEALGNIATNERGQRVISPAKLNRVIGNLDKSGKLEFIFGKGGAEQIRLLNDVATDVMTSPPSAVNTSNTASVLLGAMDTVVSFTSTGLPVPILTTLKALRNGIRDKVLRARVDRAINYNPRNVRPPKQAQLPSAPTINSLAAD